MRLPSSLAPLILGAALAPAPHAQVQLEWLQGVLGRGVGYRVTAQGGSGFVLALSLNAGPTPLALIDPLDPRNLDVGFDLVGLTTIGVVPATGEALVLFPFPAAPSLTGIPFHAQAFTWPGQVTLADELSEAVKFSLSAPQSSVLAMNDLGAARAHASVTALPDGDAVVAGGFDATGTGGALASWELYSALTQEFEPGGSIGGPRARHADTHLGGSRTLFSGGLGSSGPLASAGQLDAAAKTWTPAPAMSNARVFHTATRLPDGRVFVVGGSTQFTTGHPIGWPKSVLGPLSRSSELYDPAQNTWSSGPNLPTGLTGHGATLLANGSVLISGGVEVTSAGGRQVTKRCWLYNPTANQFQRADDLTDARSFHGVTPTASGGAMVVGGSQIDFALAQLSALDTTEVMGPQGLLWSIGPNTPGIVTCQRTYCVDGPHWPWPFPGGDGFILYLLGGGVSGIDLSAGTVAPIQEFWQLDGGLTSWSVAGSHAVPRMATGGAALTDGLRVLTVGPTLQTGANPKSGELYTHQ